MLRATLLIIGDEILSGRTRDVHLQHFAVKLGALGIALAEVRVVGDGPDEIASALRDLAGRTRYLFTTGGIGPTHDDRTVDALALAFGLTLVEDPETLAAYVAGKGVASVDALTAESRRMTRRPTEAVMVHNTEFPRSPAIRLTLPMGGVSDGVSGGVPSGVSDGGSDDASDGASKGASELFVLAGFPRVAVAQLEAVLPLLETGQKMLSETRAFPVMESMVAAPLTKLVARHPAVAFGSYPQEPKDGKYETQVVARSTDATALQAAIKDLEGLLGK